MRCRSGDRCPRDCVEGERFCPRHLAEMAGLRRSLEADEARRRDRRRPAVRPRRCRAFECGEPPRGGTGFCPLHSWMIDGSADG